MAVTNRRLAAMAATLAAPALALAQPAAPGETPAQDATAETQPAPSLGPQEAPKLPDVRDAMLESRLAPKHQLSTWRQALRLVRTRASQLRIARAQIAQAQGNARRALAGTLPQVTGSASLTRHLLFGTGANFTPAGVDANTTIPDPAHSFDAAVDVRQPLFALGTWHAIGTARHVERSVEMSARDNERIMLGTVAEGAVSVITAERVAEISRVALGSALSTLDLTRRRAQLGAASAVDVLRAEQEVVMSRAQVVGSDEAVARSREALGMALGDDEPWGVDPNVDLGELSRTAAEVCQTVPGVEDRSDLRAARMQVEVAERNETAVDYRYAPTLDLTSRLSYMGNINRSPNGEHVTWTVGAMLSWPLFDGGDRFGDRTRAEAETQIAREQYEQTKRGANVETKQANRGVEVALARLEVSEKSQQIATESARLAKVAFVNGSGTSFDLVDSARRLREADIDLTIKRFEVVRAQIAAFLSSANCGI